MKRCLTGLMVVMLAALSIASIAAQKNTQAEAMLAAAKQKETLEGDLNAAIKQYKEIVAKYAKTDRATAAMALVRMADAYKRMGDAQSLKIYEQVVKDYPEQKDAVTLAQARLGGTEQSAGPVSRTAWTSGPFPGYGGTLSSDGRFFSYNNNHDVFLHEIATGVDVNLTNQPKDSKGQPYESAISPDGKRVAYTWKKPEDGRYDLRIADLAGDPNPRTLFANPEVYDIYLDDWSRDGKWLAVELHRNDKSAQIGVISVVDGSLKPLTSIDWLGDRGIQGMYFSPDGKYLGYDLIRNKERDVYVLAVDGSSQIPAVQQPGNDQTVGWSPDGKWLLFRSDRSGTVDLYAVAFSDGKPQRMPQRLKGNIGGYFHPIGWTRNGALYYQSTSGGGQTSKVQLASLDFTARNLLSAPISSRGYQENTSSPAWSPDGKRLAYLSGLRDRGGNDELVIRATDSGTIVRELRPKQLSSITTIKAWAPDGRSILVGASDVQFQSGIYRVDAETGDAFPVVVNQPNASLFFWTIGNLGETVWMPDGLTFLTTDTTSPGGGLNSAGLYSINMQTGDISALALGQISGLAVSRNGKTLYYRRAFAANDVAFIERDLASGNERELIRSSSGLGAVNLSPDGQSCVTVSTDAASNSRVLLLIPTTGGLPRELLRVSVDVKPEDLKKRNVGPWVAALSWAPNSQSLLLRKTFNEPNKDDELWLFSLDGQESGKVQVPRGFGNLSPDNRYAAYTVSEPGPPATTEVSVLENFLPKSPKK